MTAKIDYSQYTMAGLLGMYNDAAAALGRPSVKRFSDRATAERRTAAIREERRNVIDKPAALAGAYKSQGTTFRPISEAEVEAVDKIPGMGPAIITRPQTISERVAMKEALASVVDKTPAPPPAAKPERWRQPKKWPPAKTAYRPRPGSLQAEAYKLLTAEPRVTVEALSAHMSALMKPGVKNWDLKVLWANVTYTLCSGRGYGAEFDGTHIWLIVPKDERAAPTKKGGVSAEQKAANAAALGALAKGLGA